MRFPVDATIRTSLGHQPLKLKLAQGLWSRFRGLMLTRPLPHEPQPHGMLITRCPSVHGFFMLYSLDIVYLAAQEDGHGGQRYTVTHTTHLKPWSISIGKNRSAHALELPRGAIEVFGIAPGDQLEVFA